MIIMFNIVINQIKTIDSLIFTNIQKCLDKIKETSHFI